MGIGGERERGCGLVLTLDPLIMNRSVSELLFIFIFILFSLPFTK